jgi:hypothetical protein
MIREKTKAREMTVPPPALAGHKVSVPGEPNGTLKPFDTKKPRKRWGSPAGSIPMLPTHYDGKPAIMKSAGMIADGACPACISLKLAMFFPRF